MSDFVYTIIVNHIKLLEDGENFWNLLVVFQILGPYMHIVLTWVELNTGDIKEVFVSCIVPVNSVTAFWKEL